MFLHKKNSSGIFEKKSEFFFKFHLRHNMCMHEVDQELSCNLYVFDEDPSLFGSKPLFLLVKAHTYQKVCLQLVLKKKLGRKLVRRSIRRDAFLASTTGDSKYDPMFFVSIGMHPSVVR